MTGRRAGGAGKARAPRPTEEVRRGTAGGRPESANQPAGTKTRQRLRDLLLPTILVAAITAAISTVIATPINEALTGLWNGAAASDGAGGALQIRARYYWQLTPIAWALPDELTAGEEQTLLGLSPAGDRTAAVTDLLASHDPVLIGMRDPTWLDLTVIGNHERPVVLVGLRAIDIVRKPPLSGTLIFGSPWGDAWENVELVVDLDAANPVARYLDPAGKPREPYFGVKTVSLAAGEPIRFIIRGQTAQCYCEWKILIEALVDGERQDFVVGAEDGRPLRTTAFADQYQTLYGPRPGATDSFARCPTGTPRLSPIATVVGAC